VECIVSMCILLSSHWSSEKVIAQPQYAFLVCLKAALVCYHVEHLSVVCASKKGRYSECDG
jgi:hypothetical protein